MAHKRLTEDKVRDIARDILGFEDTETAKSGVGQLTSWTQLGFKAVKGAPDGWYLPNVTEFPAIIAEFKASTTTLNKPQIDKLKKSCDIVGKRYKKVIGILWNGDDILVFKNGLKLENESKLQNKEYYLGLFSENKIDKQRIYILTKRINDSLHIDFGIKNLNHRMIFTACALVAKRYGASLVKGMNYETFHTSIHSTLAKSYEDARKQNTKLDIMLDEYAKIRMNSNENQVAIDNFIDCVTEISDNINSDYWNGEDVMAIFFNEFNRYKGKSERGQIFTPDHITSLIYRITGMGQDDVVLDAACGSGAFLVKAMCNMIKEAGGNRTTKAKEIKNKQLFGIEFDKEVYALACANMLIHKDGKTNIEQLDSRSDEAKKWIKSKAITKVLMNPPFENKYGCLKIVENVLDSVSKDVTCAFIMPDNKLEKNIRQARRMLLTHKLEKIIKLPIDIFSGVTTSIFIFRSNVPQNNTPIFACYIESDGLETVKNQGRQDTKNRWQKNEDYWVNVIYKQSGNDTIQWLDPAKNLSYQMPEDSFEISKADFNRSVLNYILFEKNINELKFRSHILDHVLYGCEAPKKSLKLINFNSTKGGKINTHQWEPFLYADIFTIKKGKRLTKASMRGGNINYIGATALKMELLQK